MTSGRAEIARAADVLRAGGLVAFPTETVYGLGADGSSPDAVHRLFAVKGRPADHPVIVHLGDAAELDEWGVDIADSARDADAAVLARPADGRRAPRRGRARRGHRRARHRRPARADQPVALELLRAFAGGVAAPSANRFGRVSPTTAQDVQVDLGDDVDVILDGGACRVGVESTIVDCSRAEPVLLRLGGLPRERIDELLGRDVPLLDTGEIRAPGTLASHYAPRAEVEFTDVATLLELLDEARARHETVGVIGAAVGGAIDDEVAELGIPRDSDEYAHDLYRMLRDADARGLDRVIAVVPDPTGLGAAVADRLRRAAGGR